MLDVSRLRNSTSRAVPLTNALIKGQLLKRSDHKRAWRERLCEVHPASSSVKAKLSWAGNERTGSILLDNEAGVRCEGGQLIVKTPQRTLRFQKAADGVDLEEWREAMLKAGARPMALLGRHAQSEYSGERNDAGQPDGRGKLASMSGDLYEGECSHSIA